MIEAATGILETNEDKLVEAVRDAVITGEPAPVQITMADVPTVVINETTLEQAYDITFDPLTRKFNLITIEYDPTSVKSEVFSTGMAEMNYKLSKLFIDKALKKGYK